MLPLHCLFSTGVSQQNCNSPPVTSLAKKPSGSSLLEKVTFVSSSQHSCTLICHVAIDLQVNGHNFFFPRPPLLLRVLHDTDCCTLQFINHHMSVLHNYLGDMLHFWLYVGCYQSARDNSTLDTPISALEGASPLRKQCCRQVLLHSILPLTAGGGQQLAHHPWTRTVQSNVIHDNFLPWHYPSTYVTELRKDHVAHTYEGHCCHCVVECSTNQSPYSVVHSSCLVSSSVGDSPSHSLMTFIYSVLHTKLHHCGRMSMKKEWIGQATEHKHFKIYFLHCPTIFLKGLRELGKTLIITMDEQA